MTIECEKCGDEIQGHIHPRSQGKGKPEKIYCGNCFDLLRIASEKRKGV